jgi:hypothetical protein
MQAFADLVSKAVIVSHQSGETTALVSSRNRCLPLITHAPLGRHGVTFPGKLAAEIGEAMSDRLGEGFLGASATLKQELVKILYFFARSWRKYGKIELVGCCCHDLALLARETVPQMNMHDKFSG